MMIIKPGACTKYIHTQGRRLMHVELKLAVLQGRRTGTYPHLPKTQQNWVGMCRYPHPPTHWGEHFGYYPHLPTQGYFRGTQPCFPSNQEQLHVFFPSDSRIDDDSRYSHSHHVDQTLPIVVSSELYRRQHHIQRFSRRVLLLLLSTPHK